MNPIFAANWKLHKTPKETRSFFSQFNDVKPETKARIVFFPTAICAEATSESLSRLPQLKSVEWGVQNGFTEAKGAFTGENSMQVVKELGGKWVLIGHSERRSLFAETDEQVAKKAAFALTLGLTPMICIGETLAEREAGQTFQTLEKQLEKGLSQIAKSAVFVLAYEPVWAIGTGRVATSEQVQEAHRFIFEFLKKHNFSTETPILYGGSVKPENAKELIQVPHVNGFLVGGASLEPATFLGIISST